MKKKEFIQQHIFSALEMTKEEDPTRFEKAITYCEIAWSKLSERGYGEVVKKGSSVVEKLKSRHEYSESFEKGWRLWTATPKGDKHQASMYWEAIDESLYEWIYYAIPKYLSSISPGAHPGHFSSFLSKQYWEGFPIKTESATPQVVNRNAEAQSLQRLIDNTKDENTKNMLIDQLNRLKKTA